VAQNPKTIVIDPRDCLDKVFSRDRMCHHIDEALKPIQGRRGKRLLKWRGSETTETYFRKR
jgi:hypothetical protein